MSRTQRASGLRWVLVALLVSGTVSCASYTHVSQKTRDLLANGEYATALAEIDKTRSGPDELLLLMERGLVLHYQGEYESSNQSFQAAEDKVDELYTRRVSTEAAALLTTDLIRPYDGAHYERVMIHFYGALNYIALGLRQDALVEARKASSRLALYTQDLVDPAYGDDPFMQYFTGLIYEWGGQLNDAYISYRNAERAYQAAASSGGPAVPAQLKRDLMRVAQALAFHDETARWRERYPDVDPIEPEDGQGEILLLVELGFVPRLVEATLNVPILKTDSQDRDRAWVVAQDAYGRRYAHGLREVEIAYWLKIAYPVLEAAGPSIGDVTVAYDGKVREMVTVSDIAFNAAQDFRDREKSIVVRTIARALLKYLSKQGAEKEVGWFAGLLVNLFGVATERADTRSWRSLPREIALARFPVAAGVHDILVEAHDANGDVRERVTLTDVEVSEGATRWVTYRLYR